jgi:serine/threonine protein kinase/tetratricopeptide (TPR) repeat protein
MIGQTISHYTILEKLGEGGMGVVYKAEDTKLDRVVALKFLPPHLEADEETRKRFIHEAKAAAALDHPDICTIYEINEAEGHTFLSMAYIDGERLKDKIDRGPLKVEEVLEIAVHIAQGLQAAHEKGIIHRDIKSANVMLTVSGQVKVMDFGLAKLAGRTMVTREGTTLGTAAYMSPEQARGEETDSRTDIWSLGVVLYELLTGRLPFRGDYEEALVFQIVNSTPDPLTSVRTGLPIELERIVNKCLEKKRDERYQTAADLIADLRHLQRTLASGTQLTQPSVTTVAGARSARKAWWGSWAFPVIVFIAVAAVIFYLGRMHLSKPREKPITSIAVLPLQNLSPDPGQEYFSDGMTEAIIKELSQIKALRVISRTSVMRYKNTNKTIPQIARELGIDAVIEGSVLRADHDVRITAQLIAADPERHLWAKDFTRSLENVLLLQSEVAQAIAGEIKIAVTPKERERITRAARIDPEAHEAYLKGEYFVNKAVPADVYKGIACFQQAIARDSTYALAYAGVGKAYDYLVGLGELSPREMWPKVKTYAEKALALDPALADGILLIAEVKLYFECDVKGAEEYYQRALELNPNLTDLHMDYGWFLASQGRFDSAITELRKARQLDPLSVVMTQQLAAVYAYAGQYDSALTYLRQAAEIDSTFLLTATTRCYVYLAQSAYPKAIEEAQKLMSLGDRSGGSLFLARAYALSGQTEKARDALAKLLQWAGNHYVSPNVVADVYCALGDREHVFEYLEKAYEERDVFFIQPALMPPWCDFIKSDPQYKELLKKVGFEQ